MTVFLDTNVLLGAFDDRDEMHARAVALLRSLAGEESFTTDHVLVESWHLIRNRVGYAGAERFLGDLRRVPLALEPVSLADLERAQSIGQAWADQRFDLVDRTSFAVMERLGCSRVASFDSDFAIYRYGPERRLPFDVLS